MMATPTLTQIIARSQRRPVFRRFWPKVDTSAGPDKCWPWIAGTDKFGYGTFATWNDLPCVAHRMAYLACVGPIPGDLIVRHKCDNPPCCNPDHLELGTRTDNARDKVERGRCRNGTLRGSANPRAKLTEGAVSTILARLAEGKSDASLAREYGIDKKGIRLIRLGLVWRHVPRPPKP